MWTSAIKARYVVLQDLLGPSRMTFASHKPQAHREMGTALVRPQQAREAALPPGAGSRSGWAASPGAPTFRPGSSQPEGAGASADPPGNGSLRFTAIEADFSPKGFDVKSWCKLYGN